MRLNKLAAIGALLLMAAPAGAAHIWEDAGGWWDSHFVAQRGQVPKYTHHELSLDLFGSFFADQRGIEHVFDTDIRDGKWGGGVGLNYFATRHLGLGFDMNMADNGGNLVDFASGNLYGRLPLGESGLAPYIFGGGGRTTDGVWDWFAQGGVGLEWRFNPMTGIFADGRYMWMDHEIGDKLLLRAGFRVVF